MEIYKYAGEGFTKREISRMFSESRPTSKKIRIPTVDKALELPEAHRFVAKFRMEFLKKVKHIPVADKKVRLDDLESVRQRIMHLITNCHLSRGDKSISRFLTYSNKLLDVLNQARNEMEQRPGVSIGIGLAQGDLSELDDTDLQKQRDILLKKADISIQRGSVAPDEITEGDEKEDDRGPPEVLLAPPKKLQRGKLQSSKPDVSNVRQQKGDDKGLPAV